MGGGGRKGAQNNHGWLSCRGKIKTDTHRCKGQESTSVTSIPSGIAAVEVYLLGKRLFSYILCARWSHGPNANTYINTWWVSSDRHTLWSWHFRQSRQDSTHQVINTRHFYDRLRLLLLPVNFCSWRVSSGVFWEDWWFLHVFHDSCSFGEWSVPSYPPLLPHTFGLGLAQPLSNKG